VLFLALLALLINCFYHLLHLNVTCFEQINLIDLKVSRKVAVISGKRCRICGRRQRRQGSAETAAEDSDEDDQQAKETADAAAGAHAQPLLA